MDLECTCEQNDRHYPNEIIEFPVILIESRTLRRVSEFHRFVRPVLNPILSPFCQELTGITQEMVNDAQTFPVVLHEFEEWLRANLQGNNSICFITDGIWDIIKFISFEFAKLQRHNNPSWVRKMKALFETWVDCRQVFQNFYGYRPQGIEGMLAEWNLPFCGRLHSGIADARNIASIVINMMQDGCIFGAANMSVIESNESVGSEDESSAAATIDSSLLQIIREIKIINKTLLCDKKQNRFSSHNKYQTYLLRGNFQQVKSFIPTMKLVPVIQPSLSSSAPPIKCTIQTSKKIDLIMKLNDLEIIEETEYEENPFTGQEFYVDDEFECCSFKIATFLGTLDQLKRAVATLKRGEGEHTEGNVSALTLYFYVPRDYQLQVCFPWDSHSCGKSLLWIDVTAKHTQKQRSHACKMALTIDKLLKLNPSLAPPTDVSSEAQWRAWRRLLIQRKKELQNRKAKLLLHNNSLGTQVTPTPPSSPSNGLGISFPSRTTRLHYQSTTFLSDVDSGILPPSPSTPRNFHSYRSPKSKLSRSPNWKPKFFLSHQINTTQWQND
jgi:inhibitor of KinA sporulation pathway (predicted exonuclease)